MHRALVACALVACAAGACKKEAAATTDAAPTPTTAATEIATENATENAAGESTTTAPTFAPPPVEQNPDVVVLGVDTTTLTVDAPKKAALVDPYAAVIDSARASAVGCFAPLPPGAYSATIVVTVTPAGTPVDVDVQQTNFDDASVLSCLRQVGEGRTYPSTTNGRTVRIDVNVNG